VDFILSHVETSCTCRWGESLNCGHQRAYCSSPMWYMSMENHGGIIFTAKNRRTRRKPCLSATLSTTNPTWTDQGTNLGERPATNHLSHTTALENSYRMSWSSDQHSRFAFGMTRFQISARSPAILTEFFRGISQSLHANAGIVGLPQIRPRPLSSASFPIHYSLIILSFDPFQFIIHLPSFHSTLHSLSH
jgi:hypothetical protein